MHRQHDIKVFKKALIFKVLNNSNSHLLYIYPQIKNMSRGKSKISNPNELETVQALASGWCLVKRKNILCWNCC